MPVVLNWRRAPAASTKWLIGSWLARTGEGIGEPGVRMMEEAAAKLAKAGGRLDG